MSDGTGGPPYPQPFQQGYPPDFGRPKRRNGLLAGLIAGILVLAAVATFAVIRLTSGDNDQPAQPGPASAEPTDQTPTAGPSEQPSQEPSRTPSGPRTASADTVTAAFEKAGFACYLAVRDPVTVHRCYLEPLQDGQDGLYNEQRITMQSTGTGVKSLEVMVKVYRKPAAVTPVYRKAMRALAGSLLPAADVRTILAANPATKKLELTWGSAEQDVNKSRDSHSLTVVATGERTVPIGFTKTKVTYGALLAAYARQGYRCYTKFTIRRCETTKAGGVFYHVHAVDPCQKAPPRLAKVCKGAPVYSVSMTVGFNSVSDDLFRTILKEFHALTALTAGGPAPEANAWMDTRLTGKPFMADYGGLQYSILPGTGTTNGQKNAVTLTIEGFNPV